MDLSEQAGPKFQALVERATDGLRVLLENKAVSVERGTFRLTLEVFRDRKDNDPDDSGRWLKAIPYGRDVESGPHPAEDAWENLGYFITDFTTLLPEPLWVIAAAHLFRQLEAPARVRLGQVSAGTHVPAFETVAADLMFLGNDAEFLNEAKKVLEASRMEATMDRDLPASTAVRGGPRL